MAADDAVGDLVAELEAAVDDGLLGVVSARRDEEPEYVVHHLREDVAEMVDEDERASIAQEILMEAIFVDDLYFLGDHDYTIASFEHGVLLLFTLGPGRSVVAGIEPSESVDYVALARRCRDLLEDAGDTEAA